MTITSADVIAMHYSRQRRRHRMRGIQYTPGEWWGVWLAALARAQARWADAHGIDFRGWADG